MEEFQPRSRLWEVAGCCWGGGGSCDHTALCELLLKRHVWSIRDECQSGQCEWAFTRQSWHDVQLFCAWSGRFPANPNKFLQFSTGQKVSEIGHISLFQLWLKSIKFCLCFCCSSRRGMTCLGWAAPSRRRRRCWAPEVASRAATSCWFPSRCRPRVPPRRPVCQCRVRHQTCTRQFSHQTEVAT